MTPLAYLLIVVVPLLAFGTVALALRPGRPAPGRLMTSDAIKARLRDLDEAPGTARERRALHRELMRRGLGRYPGS